MPATAASIQSLKRTQDGLLLTIYVVSTGLTEIQKSKFEAMAAGGLTVKVLDVPFPEYKNKAVDTYVSEAALLKFSLPDLFPDKEQILYLDGDTLVSSSLGSLFKTELGNRYAFVVRDIVAEMFHNHKRLGLSRYFNSGVMLLNLKLMREHNLSEKLKRKKIKDPGKFMDQDTFNSIFCENVIYGDARYNLMASNYRSFGLTIDTVNKFYDLGYTDFCSLEKDTCIFHLTGSEKPWTHTDTYKGKEWATLFSQTPISDGLLNLKKSEHFFKRDQPTVINELLFSRARLKKTISASGDFTVTLTRDGKTSFLGGENRNIACRWFGAFGKEIVVSITSYPARIPFLTTSIKSIFFQAAQFDRCVLWLDPAEFPNKERDLPEGLLRFKKIGLSILWRKNLKPHTKYFYAFLEFPSQAVITLDDDIVYDGDTVKSLWLGFLRFPDCVIARRTHRLLFNSSGALEPYSKWEWDTTRFLNAKRFDLVPTGVLGVLYPSPEKIFPKGLISATEIENYALDNDDLYLKFVEIIANVPVVRCSNKTRLDFVPGSQKVGLNLTNVLENRNDALIDILQQRFLINAGAGSGALKLLLEEKQKALNAQASKGRAKTSFQKLIFDKLIEKALGSQRLFDSLLSPSYLIKQLDLFLNDLQGKKSKIFHKLFGGDSFLFRETKIINFSAMEIPDFISEICGLSIIEEWGRWTDSNISGSCRISMKEYLPNSFRLEIKLKSFYPRNNLLLRVGGKAYSLGLDTTEKIFNIPFELEGELTKEIVLSPSICASPKEIRGVSDERMLGIGLVWLKIIREKRIKIW